MVEGTPGGQPPSPPRLPDALAQAAVPVPGRVRAGGAGRPSDRLSRTGPGDRLRTAQLGTSPIATMSLGSGGASRPGSRLTAYPV